MSPRKSSANWPLPYADPEEVGLSSERLSRQTGKSPLEIACVIPPA
jgi:hypothetical protein